MTLIDKPSGSVWGGTLLIAGSCIGAGMLALPVSTGLAGFIPSVCTFFVAWLFMVLTGLLLVEVQGWFSERANLLSMVGALWGKIGRAVSWVLYLFLFYALLVAYIAGSGHLLESLVDSRVGSALFVLLLGWVVYRGTRAVDGWNRILMGGKIGAYFLLVFLGVRYIKPSLLTHMQWPYLFFPLPLLLTAFGFHNMIPTITTYMQGDLKKVRKTIWGGSLIALGVYLIWELLVLGIVPLEGKEGLVATLQQDKEASHALAAALGRSAVVTGARFLAFFAIATSFLTQAWGLVHFLADGLDVTVHEKGNGQLCALVLLPPLFLAWSYPQIFFQGLSFAGGICAVILFGIFPALLVWQGRYQKKLPSSYRVRGGRPLLVVILVLAVFVLFLEGSHLCGARYFPEGVSP